MTGQSAGSRSACGSYWHFASNGPCAQDVRNVGISGLRLYSLVLAARVSGVLDFQGHLATNAQTARMVRSLWERAIKCGDGADLILRKRSSRGWATDGVRLAYLRLASAIGLAPLRIPVSLIVLTGGAWALMLHHAISMSASMDAADSSPPTFSFGPMRVSSFMSFSMLERIWGW